MELILITSNLVTSVHINDTYPNEGTSYDILINMYVLNQAVVNVVLTIRSRKFKSLMSTSHVIYYDKIL